MSDTLPHDIESLRELVRAQQEELRSHQLLIEKLKLELARLKRMKFGRSSEQLTAHIAQLELAIEELEVGETVKPAAIPLTAPRPANKPVRRPLPAHLPRETIVHPSSNHDASCTCLTCGGRLESLGSDVSEMLEYVPARFKVIRHVRPKLACRHCATIVQAPAPSRPIPRGVAGPGLLAHVLVSKYADHLPLYRQSEIYAREGIDLDRSTLADWVGQAARLMDPLVAALAKHVLAGAKLHADDTPVPVLAPGNGKTKLGRLWTYVRDDRPFGAETAPAVLFRYSPNRQGQHPQTHLQDFRGILQADGYAGFDQLYDKGRITEAACWAHVRRKFYDIHVATGSPIAAEALSRIGALYGIEAEIKGKPPDHRKAVREARAGPWLDQLHQWLTAQAARLSKKSELAGAIQYALPRWTALTRYVSDGRLEIDNNAAERALRTVALGRKNYLFAGSDTGGERAAALYSLIGTAKLNGLDPQAYLHHVLSRVASHPINRIEELLPWRVELPSHLAQAA